MCYKLCLEKHISVKPVSRAGGDVEAVKRLLSVPNMDPNVTAKPNGSSALHMAVKNAQLETIKLLLDDDRVSANMRNSQLSTPVHVAAEQGALEVINLLVEHPNGITDLRCKDMAGRTAAEVARMRGFIECADAIERYSSGSAPLRRWFAAEDQRMQFALKNHSILLGRPPVAVETNYTPVPPQTSLCDDPMEADMMEQKLCARLSARGLVDAGLSGFMQGATPKRESALPPLGMSAHDIRDRIAALVDDVVSVIPSYVAPAEQRLTEMQLKLHVANRCID